MKKYIGLWSFIFALLVVPAIAFANPTDVKTIDEQSEIINANPDDVVAYFKRGDAYWRNGEYDLAMADENTAIEKKSDYAAAYVIRGLCYYSLKKYEAAIDDDTKAIELQADYGLAYRNRAEGYRIVGKYDLSIVDCDKSLQIDPTKLKAYYIKGLSLEKMLKNDDAIAAYRKIIELGTSNDGGLISDAKNRIIMLGGKI
jgi:tetratricopeptide (TPR) repeat protein